MNKRILLLVSAVLAAVAVAFTPLALGAPANLAGTYACVGDNGNGSKYKGTVKIDKTGPTYRLQWTIGTSTHFGVGFVENGRLCCSWAVIINDKLANGAVVYAINGNKLAGRWTQYPGTPRILTETLTKQ
jgi:hypothetical protein